MNKALIVAASLFALTVAGCSTQGAGDNGGGCSAQSMTTGVDMGKSSCKGKSYCKSGTGTGGKTGKSG